jgi:hypothetical protein
MPGQTHVQNTIIGKAFCNWLFNCKHVKHRLTY